MLLLLSADFKKKFFQKIILWASNNLDPDQDPPNVGPDLCPKLFVVSYKESFHT